MVPEPQEDVPLAVGLDTGGTFTDAVLVEMKGGRVLKTAKHPTTHHRLGLGISRALEAVTADVAPERVRRMAFSTTLATNAVVEGRGARVGLLVIGDVKTFDLPVVSVRYVDGGHDHLGREVRPLDLEALTDALAELAGHVDAYVVAGAMSMEDSTHEQVATRAIELTDPKPVFASHQVGGRAGLKERAATAVLHARLLPVISGFVEELRELIRRRGFAGEVRMIRGDAEAIGLDAVIRRAAATAASGPAATAFFGARSAAARRALVVDVGGTTTDITLIEDGRPAVSSEGSWIGSWRTHIDAVEMDTVGIGGDSLTLLDRSGTLRIGPHRATPLAMAPECPDPGRWIGPEARARCVFLADERGEADGADSPILNLLRRERAVPAADLMARLHLSEIGMERELEGLARLGTVRISGFTPTDALHALGKLDLGDRNRSMAAAKALGALRSRSPEAFCEDVLKETRVRLRRAILNVAFRKRTGKGLDACFPESGDAGILAVSFALKIPIVALGAAARLLLPEVAEELGAHVIFPSHYEVGNALGAVWIALDAGRKWSAS